MKMLEFGYVGRTIPSTDYNYAGMLRHHGRDGSNVVPKGARCQLMHNDLNTLELWTTQNTIVRWLV